MSAGSKASRMQFLLRKERQRRCTRLFATKSIGSAMKRSGMLVSIRKLVASKYAFCTRETLPSASLTMAKESPPKSSHKGRTGTMDYKGCVRELIESVENST